jgi:hypothetical protein
MPKELVMLGYVDRFGALAVYGRTPGAKELKAMILAESVVTAYKSRSRAENWAAWARENSSMNRLLIMAVKHGE